MAHPIIAALHERRNNIWSQMQELLESVDPDEGFSGEQEASWQKMSADLDAADDQIKDLDEKESRAAAADKLAEKYAGVQTVEPSAEETAIRAFLIGKSKVLDVSFAGLQRRIDPRSGAYEVRDLSTTTTSGGYTIPTGFRAQLYEHLIANSAIRQTNATILTTASGENLHIPKTTSAGTAAIVGEGTALAEADPAFGETILGAWKYGQLIQVPTELIQDTAVDLLGYLARDAGRALGNASGGHFVTGTGTNQPLGVMVAAGTGVTGGTGQVGVPTAAELISLQYSVEAAYANQGYWLMARATEGKIRGLVDSNGQFLWQPSLQVGSPNLLLGRPVVSDPNVAATGTNNVSVGFGDFSPYFIRDVAAVRFERSDDFAFSSDMVSFRSILRTDGDLVDLTGAIKTYVGGTA
jgi:HK97 family phage major capsid protein